MKWRQRRPENGSCVFERYGLFAFDAAQVTHTGDTIKQCIVLGRVMREAGNLLITPPAVAAHDKRPARVFMTTLARLDNISILRRARVGEYYAVRTEFDNQQQQKRRRENTAKYLSVCDCPENAQHNKR